MPTDRRAGKENVPHVGKVPRARTKAGAWRKKRSDAGKKRSDAGKKKEKKDIFGIPGIKL